MPVFTSIDVSCGKSEVLSMSRFIAPLLVAMLHAGVAGAQIATPASGAPLSLAAALTAARAHSPAMARGSAEVKATEAARTVAGLRPNPSLVTEVQNVAGTGVYRRFDSAETTVGLALPIELGGKRSARIGVADSRSNRACIDAAIAEADLVQRVTQAYIATAAAEQRLATARAEAVIAVEALRGAQVRVSAGKASPIEQQRAEVLRLNAGAAVERSGRALDLARGNLSRLTGITSEGGVDLAWFDRIDIYGPTRPVDAETTLALAAARADAATARAQVGVARAARVPDVTVSASARRISATNDNAAVFGLSVPLPLFNNGDAALAQARADEDRANAERQLVALDAAQAIASAQAEVANAATTARATTGPVLAAATEAARIARIGYREGKFGQLDLLDAERTLLETRDAAIDALSAYHDAEALLERLTAPATLQMDDHP
jgi:cobalt-zinc-cadmium efflux system outer membrane protein